MRSAYRYGIWVVLGLVVPALLSLQAHEAMATCDCSSGPPCPDPICVPGCSQYDPCSATCYDAAEDFDSDGVRNGCDNCPTLSNPTQADADGDGIGDACDPTPDSQSPSYLEYAYDELGRCTQMKRDGLHLVRYKYTGDDLVQRSVRTEYAARAVVSGASEVHIDHDITPGPFGKPQRLINSPKNYTYAGGSETLSFDPQHQLENVGLYYGSLGLNWRSPSGGHAKLRWFNASYDRLERLTQTYGLTGSNYTQYNYDLLGNRTSMTVGAPTSITRGYVPDGNNNQYDLISIQPPTPAIEEVPEYDLNGNLVRDDGLDAVDGDGVEYGYDAENRLTHAEYDNGQGQTKWVDYRYDALGRRIESVEHDPAGGTTTTVRYYYDSQNVIAEYHYDAVQQQEFTVRTYVNGMQYIDERVLMRDFTNRTEYPKQRDHYYIVEELYTVAGLVSANGALEEAYVYDDYGQVAIYEWPAADTSLDGQVTSTDTTFFTSISNPGVATAYPFADLDMDGDVDSVDVSSMQYSSARAVGSSSRGNPYLFTGRPTVTLASYTPPSGTAEYRRIQDNRNRTYDPKHGRWLQRDPRGMRPTLAGLLLLRAQFGDGADLFVYAKNSPTRYVDSFGTSCSKSCDDQCGKVGDKRGLILSVGYVAGGSANPDANPDDIADLKSAVRIAGNVNDIYTCTTALGEIAGKGLQTSTSALASIAYTVSWWWSGVDIRGMIENKIETASFRHHGFYVWHKIRVDTCGERCCGRPEVRYGFETGFPVMHLTYRHHKYWKPGATATWHKCRFARPEHGVEYPDEPDRLFPSDSWENVIQPQLEQCAEQAAEAAGLPVSSSDTE